MKILLVEDDVKIISFLKKGLEEEYFCVDICSSGEDALYLAKNHLYDIIILDLTLQELSGDVVCQKIREHKIITPIIILSARSSIHDKVTLLHLGANDYLTKPFSFDELLARIHVQLRKKDLTETHIRVADLDLNLLTKIVTRTNNPITLTAKEYMLLEYLLRHKNTIVNEQILENQLFTFEQNSQSNILQVYMYRLRTKIDKNHALKLIKTYRNLGYMISENSL